jgi:uncharacterized iron-regulated membrane protein
MKRRARIRQILRKLHLVLGLTVGLWVAMTALTGSVLVFGDGIDSALNRQLLSVEARARPTAVDTAVGSVRGAFAHRPLRGVQLPQAPHEPLVFRLGGAQATDVYVNPYTGKILGSRAQYGGVIGFLWDLHVHLLTGEAGETVAGLLALAFLVMLVTGIVLWWPGRARLKEAFAIRWRRGSPRRMFDLHRVAGAVAAPWLLIAALTGSLLVFYSLATPLLVASLGGPARAPLPTIAAPPKASALPLSVLLAHAEWALPEARSTRVTFPATDSAVMVIRRRHDANSHPNGRSFVAVNAYTGEILQVHDWRRAGLGLRVADYEYPLHIGAAFGLPGRILVLIAGLVPALLWATGTWLWWHKRKSRGLQRNIVGSRHARTR